MRFFVDLHIHSYYSRATSKKLNLEHLNKWAQIKGLSVVATGDITHPKWLEEMKEKLEPAEQGLYRLKKEYAAITQAEVPASCRKDIYFILSGEISNIYKKDSRVRKNHNVVFMPSLQAVEKFQEKLDRIGNIRSDGRPILGLDSRDLLEIALETDSNAHLVPAHIWTPWFSLLGSKSGFDTVEECFQDLTPYIFALETGLSSDPPMNWRLSMLDRYNLVSNSDAHSPEKLAREANVFECPLNYDAMFSALKNKDDDRFWGTIEFFPEEGKYHMDGHRKCSKMMFPKETIQNKGLCPVCGKPAVLGVSYRVEELADRDEGIKPKDAKNFKSLVPLKEVISEVFGVGPASKKVQILYESMYRELGSELDILMNLSLQDIKAHSGSIVAEAIHRMREGRIHPEPGYDGEYGVIRIFSDAEKDEITQQKTLFNLPGVVANKKPEQKVLDAPAEIKKQDKVREIKDEYGLNVEQRKAVKHRGGPLVIIAGPGTGKTRTLTYRIHDLISSDNVPLESILAVTFTNKAALEMRERLNTLLASKIEFLTIETFHAFCLNILRNEKTFLGRSNKFSIVDVRNDAGLKKLLKARCGFEITNSLVDKVSFLKGQFYGPDDLPKEIEEQLSPKIITFYKEYDKFFLENNLLDYDDLIMLTVKLLRSNPDVRRKILQKYQYISVDEFQDINPSQYELFKLLAISAKDVCVIGDPNQAIYGFRGADRKFFVNFRKDFPNSKQIKLVQNYRSSQNILKASTQLIGRSEMKTDENLWSNIVSDVKVQIHENSTDRAEAEYIVHQIEKFIGGTSHFSIDTERVENFELQNGEYGFSDIAVLFRNRSLLPPLVEALTRSGIPYQNINKDQFIQQPQAALILAALKIINAPMERLLWTNFLELLDIDLSIKNEIQEKFNFSSLESLLTGNLNLESNSPVIQFLQFVKDYHSHTPKNVCDVLEKILVTFEIELDVPVRKKLFDLARPYDLNLVSFLDTLLLQKEQDEIDSRADHVRLLTLHASKGLEFPIVFIAGCEDGIIPQSSNYSNTDYDEERRLLYVGMTRAQSFLFLTSAKTRVLYNQKHTQKPSVFLKSISNSLIKKEISEKKVSLKKNNQLNLF